MRMMAWNYTPLGGSRFRTPRYNVVLATAILSTVAAVVLFLLRDGKPRTVDPFPFSTLAPTTCDGAVTPTDHRNDDIPNLVHYVWLTVDHASFALDFKAFVSIYSAHLFLRPERIYIHTDATPAAFEHAASAGSLWTRRILAIPNVVPNYVVAPTTTSTGFPLTRLEHRSDVVRIRALRDFGGLYLDFDAIPLRDLAPLRTAGFSAVLGPVTAISVWQSGLLNNGVMLSRAHSPFIEIYHDAFDRAFAGDWDTASQVLTDMALRVAAVPRSVLIVESRAFAPFSWEVFDMNRLYGFLLGKPTEDDGAGEAGLEPTCANEMAWLRAREKGAARRSKDEADLSNTYILHAFDGNLGRFHGLFSPQVEIDLAYVMRRESNYARAVWPAISHAIEAGLIPEVGE